MTREEREKAIKCLKWFKEYNEEDYCGGDRIEKFGDWFYRITEREFEIFDMIIDWLSQEPILDKVKAEVEELNNIDYVEPITVEEVLKIVNKYIQEG